MQDVKIGKEYQAEVSNTVSAIISGMRNIGRYSILYYTEVSSLS